MELTFRTAGIGDLELLTESRLRAIRTYRHLSETAALTQVTAWHEPSRGRYIATVNAEIVMRAQTDAALAAALDEADMVLPPPAAWTSAGRCPPITIPRVCPAIS